MYSPNLPEAIYENLRWFQFTFFCILGIDFIRNKPQLEIKIASVLIFSAVLVALMSIFQFYGFAFLNVCQDDVMPCSYLGNRNFVGSYLTLCIPFCLFLIQNSSPFSKKLFSLCFLLISYVIFLSQTRMAYFVYIFTLLIYLFFEYKSLKISGQKGFYAILFVGLAIFGLTFWFKFDVFVQKLNFSTQALGSLEERWQMWQKSLSMIRDNYWIKGTGLGNWNIFYPKYDMSHTRTADGLLAAIEPHNDYLSLLAEIGILGLLAYLLVFFGILIMAFKKRSSSIFLLSFLVLLAYLLHSLMSFPKERIEHLALLSIPIGIILSRLKPDLNQKSNKTALVFGCCLLVLSFLTSFFAYHRFQTDKLILLIRQKHTDKNYGEVIALYDKLNPFYQNLDSYSNPIYLYISDSYFNQKDYEKTVFLGKKSP